MKTLTLFLYGSMCCSYCFSQQWSWAHSFGHSFIDEGYNIASDQSGNIYISGEKKHFSNSNNKNYLYNFLWKFDKNGKKLWEDTIQSAQCRQATTPEGVTYLAAGDKLAKFSADGIKKWVKKDTVMIVGSVAYYPTGGAVLLSLGKHYQSILTRYDAEGNVIWKKSHANFPHHGIPGDHLACDNQGFIYLAAGFEWDTLNATMRVVILKLSPNGDIVSKNTIVGAQKFILNKTTKEFYLVRRGGIIHLNSTTFDHTNELYPPTYIIKYDSTGAVQWYNKCNENVSCLTLNSDNLYIAGRNGKKLIFDDREFNFISENSTYVAQLSQADGHIKSATASESKDATGAAYILGITATANDDILTTGGFTREHQFGDHKINVQSMYSDMFVAKIQFDAEITSISEKYQQIPANSVTVYPNPFSNFVTLESTTLSTGKVTISVVNLLGATVYSETFSTTTNYAFKKTLNLSHLTKGTYFVTISSKYATETKKIILN